jgi:hypothetical protein
MLQEQRALAGDLFLHPQRFNFVAIKLRANCIFSMITILYTPQTMNLKKAACILPHKISESYVTWH